MEYQELLPLLPGMSVALPPGGAAPDLVLLRTVNRALSPEQLEEVREDLLYLERVISPEVMPVLEHVLDGQGLRAAYPWKDGLPLAAALARAREAGVFPSLAVAGRLVSEVAGALAALHMLEDANGTPTPLVHGVFRADSLWLGFDGKMQLSDAGACSVISRTEPGVVRDMAADVMAAGIIAHVVVTGHAPMGTTLSGHDPRIIRPDIPEPVALIIMQATHPDPAQRFLDGGLMRGAWDSALSILGGVGVPEQVNRWLCTLFPANHPLIGVLRQLLTPLGGGTLLPANQGPLLTSSRLAPVRSPSQGAMPPVGPPPGASQPRMPAVVSSPGLAPVPMTQPGLAGPGNPSQPRMPPVATPASGMNTSSAALAPVSNMPAAAYTSTLEMSPIRTVEAPAPLPSAQPQPAYVATLARMAAVPERAALPLGTPNGIPAAGAMPSPAEAPLAPEPDAAPPRQRTGRRRAVRAAEEDDDAVDDLEVTRPKRGWGAAVLVAVALLLVAGGMLMAFKLGQTTPESGYAPQAAAPPPDPAPTPEPAAATPPPAAAAPAKAAPTKTTRKPTPTRRNRTARAAPQKHPAQTEPVDDGDKATLHLDITPWAKVYVDNRYVGKTPIRPLKLSPGRHRIKLVCEEYKASRVEMVDVQSGMEGTLTVQFTPPM